LVFQTLELHLKIIEGAIMGDLVGLMLLLVDFELVAEGENFVF